MTLEDEPPISDLGVPPWGSRQLRRLGVAIRDEQPAEDAPSYSDVMLWYDDLGAAVQSVLRGLDWGSLVDGRPAPEISSRAKTIDTLRDKLRRDPKTPLSSVQDVAGVRFEAEMTLEEQDIVARAIAQAFGQDETCIHDLREHPRYGYRAVHVWLRLRGGRVEVQVRTHIQGAWANAYEALADVAGREIRYGQKPTISVPELEQLVRRLQELSIREAAALEAARQQAATLKVELGLSDQELRERAVTDLPSEVVEKFFGGLDNLAGLEKEFMTMLRSIERLMRDVQRKVL
jgi:ppGpp synthetase/RelA/SpoT-type nucleotidyltranferase